MTRRLKKGGRAAVLSLVVAAAVIVFNMIIEKLPEGVRQWDISSGKIYSVGDTTRELLSALDKEVTIYVVADPGGTDERITSFVNRYAELSGFLHVETVDPVLHPAKVNELEAENNSLLVTCGQTGRKETIPFEEIIKFDEMSYYYYGSYEETEFDGEGRLTSAVSYVTSDVEKSVYQTEGHGETALGPAVADLLEKSGLTLKSLNLLKEGGIPEDCDLLIVNAPVEDLADDEKNTVMDYLDQGGAVTVLAGYSQKDRPNLKAVLNSYGLKLEDGLAADTGANCYYQGNPYNIFPTFEAGSGMMDGVDAKSTALVIRSSALSRTDNPPEGVSLETFMKTSENGLLVTGEEQTEGTYILGAVAEKTLENGRARLTVFSTPSLIDEKLNAAFSGLSNLKVFMNAVTSNFEDVVNVSIPAKSLAVAQNVVSHGGAWGALFILVIPVLVLACGMGIWIRRRRL